jgi:PmbA protein
VATLRANAEAVVDAVLARAMRSAQEAEVLYVASESAPLHWEANAIKGADASDAAGVAVRLIKDGRVGFSSTSNLDDLDGLVAAALETAPFGAEARFHFPGPQALPEVPVHDPATANVSLDEMASLGQGIVDAVRARFPEAQVEGGVSRSSSRMVLRNSAGGGVSYARSRFGAGFGGTVIRGEDMLFTHESDSSVHPVVDTERIIASICRQLEWARETAPITTEAMPVLLLESAVASVLLGPLLAGLNGKAVYQGTSPLAGRLGEQVADPRFSLTDDATIPWRASARPADDEGVASRRLPLIESGAIAGFYYDLQTAGLAGVQSTGSGERGLGSLPGPSTSVLVVGDGDTPLEAMIAGMDEGLIVESLLGAGQSNILGGDFNANVLLGYKVEGGRVVGRVKNAMISGNAYDALSSLRAVGSDGRWVGGGFYTPSIALERVSVSAQGKA